MSKHTPGPWSVKGMSSDWALVINLDLQNKIAQTHNQPDSMVTMANAKLIAAAPDLLEALQEIVKCEINRSQDLGTLSKRPGSLYDFSIKRVEKARAAIAKATEGV